MCERERVCVRERERVGVCESEWVRETVCMYVCVREREIESAGVYV